LLGCALHRRGLGLLAEEGTAECRTSLDNPRQRRSEEAHLKLLYLIEIEEVQLSGCLCKSEMLGSRATHRVPIVDRAEDMGDALLAEHRQGGVEEPSHDAGIRRRAQPPGIEMDFGMKGGTPEDLPHLILDDEYLPMLIARRQAPARVGLDGPEPTPLR